MYVISTNKETFSRIDKKTKNNDITAVDRNERLQHSNT